MPLGLSTGFSAVSITFIPSFFLLSYSELVLTKVVCGDIENINTVGAAIVDDSQCGVPCSGNATTLCGGNNLLSYYSWTGAPLYSWDFRTGTEAGEYSLLIGGVCIPLMTAQTVNGKVTFVS